MANAAGRNARYKVMLGGSGVTHARPLVIIDKSGPDDPSITNDAEWVIADLYAKGLIGQSRRVLYVDSQGELAALLHTAGRFDGFGPARDGEEKMLVTPDPLPVEKVAEGLHADSDGLWMTIVEDGTGRSASVKIFDARAPAPLGAGLVYSVLCARWNEMLLRR